MTWDLIIARSARKALERLPNRERTRITETLVEMRADPYSGDVKRLRNYSVSFRRRVGSYRILFDLDPDEGRIEVLDITRRDDRTYRRR